MISCSRALTGDDERVVCPVTPPLRITDSSQWTYGQNRGVQPFDLDYCDDAGVKALSLQRN